MSPIGPCAWMPQLECLPYPPQMPYQVLRDLWCQLPVADKKNGSPVRLHRFIYRLESGGAEADLDES